MIIRSHNQKLVAQSRVAKDVAISTPKASFHSDGSLSGEVCIYSELIFIEMRYKRLKFQDD